MAVLAMETINTWDKQNVGSWCPHDSDVGHIGLIDFSFTLPNFSEIVEEVPEISRWQTTVTHQTSDTQTDGHRYTLYIHFCLGSRGH